MSGINPPSLICSCVDVSDCLRICVHVYACCHHHVVVLCAVLLISVLAVIIMSLLLSLWLVLVHLEAHVCMFFARFVITAAAPLIIHQVVATIYRTCRSACARCARWPFLCAVLYWFDITLAATCRVQIIQMLGMFSYQPSHVLQLFSRLLVPCLSYPFPDRRIIVHLILFIVSFFLPIQTLQCTLSGGYPLLASCI